MSLQKYLVCLICWKNCRYITYLSRTYFLSLLRTKVTNAWCSTKSMRTSWLPECLNNQMQSIFTTSCISSETRSHPLSNSSPTISLPTSFGGSTTLYMTSNRNSQSIWFYTPSSTATTPTRPSVIRPFTWSETTIRYSQRKGTSQPDHRWWEAISKTIWCM